MGSEVLQGLYFFLLQFQAFGTVLSPLLSSGSFYQGRCNLSPLWYIIISLPVLVRTGKFRNTFSVAVNFVQSSLLNSIAIQPVEYFTSSFLHFITFPKQGMVRVYCRGQRKNVILSCTLQLFCSNWETSICCLLFSSTYFKAYFKKHPNLKNCEIVKWLVLNVKFKEEERKQNIFIQTNEKQQQSFNTYLTLTNIIFRY